jgi:thioesterase domain-containing protein
MFSLTLKKWLLILLLVSAASFSGGYVFRRYLRPQLPAAAPEAIHLNRYYHFTELMRDTAIESKLLRYQSAYDHSWQTIFIMEPAGHKPERLFFFFHGMDGDSGDAVVVRDLVKKFNATVISLGGRGPAWISDAVLADTEQVIRTRMPGFPGFYLIGISMGGTQALALAGLLPVDLRQGMLGVVALIPGADLPAIEARSSNLDVRHTLQASVNSNSSLLEQRSPSRLLTQYKPDLPFVIFYEQQDTVLLTPELEKFIAGLRSNRHPVTTFSTPGEHNFTFANFDYEGAVSKLGSNLTENTTPLLAK